MSITSLEPSWVGQGHALLEYEVAVAVVHYAKWHATMNGNWLNETDCLIVDGAVIAQGTAEEVLMH